MNIENYRPLAELTAASIASFVVHQLFYYFLDVDTSAFSYSVIVLYATFFVIAIVTISLLMFIKRTNINSVGSTMMLLTCLKMVPAFMIMNPAIDLNVKNPGLERANFLIIFGVFLIIETVVAIRLLNRT